MGKQSNIMLNLNNFNSLKVYTYLQLFHLALGAPHPDKGGQESPLPIPRPDSKGNFAGDQFFQYINVPDRNVFEWGFRRGGPEHNLEEYLSQRGSTFKSKLKWHDEYDGHGEHYWDYNHGGKPEAPPKYAAPPAPAYGPPDPAYGPPSSSR